MAISAGVYYDGGSLPDFVVLALLLYSTIGSDSPIIY